MKIYKNINFSEIYNLIDEKVNMFKISINIKTIHYNDETTKNLLKIINKYFYVNPRDQYTYKYYREFVYYDSLFELSFYDYKNSFFKLNFVFKFKNKKYFKKIEELINKLKNKKYIKKVNVNLTNYDIFEYNKLFNNINKSTYLTLYYKIKLNNEIKKKFFNLRRKTNYLSKNYKVNIYKINYRMEKKYLNVKLLIYINKESTEDFELINDYYYVLNYDRLGELTKKILEI